MLGKLTAGIAHELNNPAAAVRRTAQQLRTRLLTIQEDTIQLQQLSFTPQKLQHLMQWQRHVLIKATSAPAISLLERSQFEAQLGNWLFAFGLDDAWEMAETFAHFHVTIECLNNSLLVLSHKLKNIVVTTEFDPAMPTIMARNGELYQVWTNLIDNAIDALEGMGKINIRTRRDREIAEIKVEDNGPGIPAEIVSQIFEPFFTTKQEGLGTGLGLEIVQRIISQHGGAISVESRPGTTRFTVRLPIQGVEAGEATPTGK